MKMCFFVFQLPNPPEIKETNHNKKKTRSEKRRVRARKDIGQSVQSCLSDGIEPLKTEIIFFLKDVYPEQQSHIYNFDTDSYFHVVSI